MEDNDSNGPSGSSSGLAAKTSADSDLGFTLEALEETRHQAAEEIAAEAIADPRLVLSNEAGQRAAFEARLEARWGRGLDLADLVVHYAYESGKWVNDLLRPEAAAAQDYKFEALIRLHGKAVMTAREVLLLLRGGYSSGAMARWRTLHEVWVVFELLAEGDGELSRRYLAHEEVENLKGQKDYEQTWEALGFDPPDWDADEREQAHQELKEEFGPAFLKDYGWAAPLFEDNLPRLKHLQERAGLADWRCFYRLASQGTHANPKGVTWSIQGYETVDLVWAGPSNAGLVDPAQCSLIALAKVNGGLLAHMVGELPDSADRLSHMLTAVVQQDVIFILMDRSIETLVEVDAQQEAEEESVADLTNRAAAILQRGAPMTAEHLSTELEIDPEDLEAVLDAAVARGELIQETRYRIDDGGA